MRGGGVGEDEGACDASWSEGDVGCSVGGDGGVGDGSNGEGVPSEGAGAIGVAEGDDVGGGNAAVAMLAPFKRFQCGSMKFDKFWSTLSGLKIF